MLQAKIKYINKIDKERWFLFIISHILGKYRPQGQVELGAHLNMFRTPALSNVTASFCVVGYRFQITFLATLFLADAMPPVA